MTVPEGYTDRSVTVIGLGYVGLTLATTLAEVGFQVTGVEVRQDVVEELRAGRPHFHEPGLQPRLARVVNERRLEIATTVDGAGESRVYVITVGTPLDEEGRVRLDMVERAAKEVASVLSDGDLVIMRSTVKLGTTTEVVKPILEAAGRSFDLAFCPERTLEGQAMEELRWLPQIVGASTHDANVRAAQLFQFVTPTVVKVRDIESAELIKMIDNTSRDVQFAFSNEIARVCDAVGVSAAEVIRAGSLGYPRTQLPLPGPVGGPCLSKDPHILVESLERAGLQPELTKAARLINERQPAEIADYLRSVASSVNGFPDRPVVALLGIAFKGRPPTDDLRGTMARPILMALRGAFPDAEFVGFDPEVGRDELRAFGLEPRASAEDAMTGANLVLLLNNHPARAALPLEAAASKMARPGFVYDLWNMFSAQELNLPDRLGYAALGGHSAGIRSGL